MLALSFARLAQYCPRVSECFGRLTLVISLSAHGRDWRCCNGGVKQSGKARIIVETEDERYERLRTTRERMAISRSQDTEERRYFRLQYDAVKRAGPTLWFSYCAQ